jgi:hypothetical protein
VKSELEKVEKKFIFILLTFIVLLALVGCAKEKTKTAEEKPKETTQEEQKEEGGVKSMFQLKSTAFENEGNIPVKYANTGVSGGENISIPLSWENPPEGTKSFAIAMVDIHPIANNWVHWLVINIPSNITFLPEGASGTEKMPAGCKELNNTWGFEGYGGPQPPPGSGDHDYVTTIYALDVESIPLEKNTSLNQFQSAIEPHVLATAQLNGKFGR